jgi:hypothetical protein
MNNVDTSAKNKAERVINGPLQDWAHALLLNFAEGRAPVSGKQ